MLRQFFIRIAFNAFGLWLAAELIADIGYQGEWGVLLIAAVILSLVNALIRPVLIVLSLPAILITFGLFTLLINALMVYLVTIIYPAFFVGSFTAAFLAVIIIWIVNHGLNAIFNRQA